MPAPSAAPTPFPAEQQVHIGQVDDVGLEINEAEKTAGVREIVLEKSGELKTPVVLQDDMRLRLEPGVVILARTDDIPIRAKERTSVIGPGQTRAAIVESSALGQFTVITGYYGSEINGQPDADIQLQGFEVRGSLERKDFNSAPQAVSFGNCKRCSMEDVWINGTHSIGAALGGAGFLGYAAEDSKVVNCRFTRVASQSLAMVNGRRILFEHNRFDAPGQEGGPGATLIDVELNVDSDVARDVIIRGNWLDSRIGSVNGNGIVVQANTHSQDVGQILVEDNVLLGGNPYPLVSNVMSNGIMVFGTDMRDVTVRHNRIWRTGQAGMYLGGAGIVAVDNELVDVGGGGTPGVSLVNLQATASKESEFSRNTFRYTGDGPSDSRIVMSNSSVKMEGNSGFQIAEAAMKIGSR